MGYKSRTICPYCTRRHELVTEALGGKIKPQDGDVTICFTCGGFCMFDSAVGGGLRKPTDNEYGEILENAMFMDAKRVWLKIQQEISHQGKPH